MKLKSAAWLLSIIILDSWLLPVAAGFTWSEVFSGLIPSTRSTEPVRVEKPSSPPKLKIGSFKVTSLGGSRIPNEKTMRQIASVICAYDVISVQGIYDIRRGNLAEQLLTVVNKSSQCRYSYTMKLSSSLDEANELSDDDSDDEILDQIAFFYRSQLLTLDTSYAATIRPGSFSIAPQIAVFRSVEAPRFKFAYIAVHLRGPRVVEELNQLHVIYQQVVAKHRGVVSAVIMAGDFNCDCQFMTEKTWKQVNLRLHTRYKWLIPTGTQTLASGGRKCAMDRIITSQQFMPAIVPDSAKVDVYDRRGSRTIQRAKTVSNHYPVQVELYLKSLVPQTSWSSSLGSWRSVLPLFSKERTAEELSEESDVDINGLPERERPPSPLRLKRGSDEFFGDFWENRE